MLERLAGTVLLQCPACSIFGPVCAPLENAVGNDGRDSTSALSDGGSVGRDSTFAVSEFLEAYSAMLSPLGCPFNVFKISGTEHSSQPWQEIRSGSQDLANAILNIVHPQMEVGFRERTAALLRDEELFKMEVEFVYHKRSVTRRIVTALLFAFFALERLRNNLFVVNFSAWSRFPQVACTRSGLITWSRQNCCVSKALKKLSKGRSPESRQCSREGSSRLDPGTIRILCSLLMMRTLQVRLHGPMLVSFVMKLSRCAFYWSRKSRWDSSPTIHPPSLPMVGRP